MQSHIRNVYVGVYSCTGCGSSLHRLGLVAQMGLVAQAVGSSCTGGGASCTGGGSSCTGGGPSYYPLSSRLTALACDST